MKAPFKIGDKVFTDFNDRDKDSVEVIIVEVAEDKSCGSGWRAAAAGIKCQTCGAWISTPIRGVDSTWFKKTKPETRK